MLVYMNRRTADRLLDSFRKAELRRVQLENQLMDSRLATARYGICSFTLNTYFTLTGWP